jgi:uncharacterized membrane protein
MAQRTLPRRITLSRLHSPPAALAQRRAFVVPGILLGVGLGGFIDGIVLHQILQWHHMVSSHGDYPVSTVAGIETNTLWDGVFHAAAWLATLAGIFALWRAQQGAPTPRSLRPLAGMLVLGWGAFNIVEGVVNHHLLTLHHVRYDGSAALPWDAGFLAASAALVIAGAILYRASSPADA